MCLDVKESKRIKKNQKNQETKDVKRCQKFQKNQNREQICLSHVSLYFLYYGFTLTRKAQPIKIPMNSYCRKCAGEEAIGFNT